MAVHGDWGALWGLQGFIPRDVEQVVCAYRNEFVVADGFDGSFIMMVAAESCPLQ